MMGLRLAEGVDRHRFAAVVGAPIEAAIDRQRLADLVDGGFVVLDEHRLSATPAGRQRLNAVLARLLC
jgi:coproporphyrinogen III oxidase-like Fe-S oxidoreductase